MLGFFSNFAVGFTYLSPMVGIYSLFVFGFGIAGPAYIWLTFIPLIGMLFVALVFGELASHYPVAGALFQYSKFSVGPRYGWFVGWFYGFALLITVAAVDTGVVFYVTSLLHNWFGNGWLGSLNPAGHGTILVITLILLAIQSTVNITGARIMADVAKFGVYVEIVGTLGIAIILAIHGFHHSLGFLFSTQGAQHAATNAYGLNFHGSWLAAALVAVLAPVYIFYGFESCGDIAEETKDAGRQIPRAMRHALIWGGVASFILTAALLLATAKHNPVGSTVAGGIPGILAQLPSWMQDFLLLVIIFAFFSCGSSIQGAGSRLAFSYARDGALPGSGWISRVNQRFKTPANALIMGAVITVLFCLLVYINPGSNYHIWFVTYPAHVNALTSLVSFGGQRHLPLVPADGDRGDHRPRARLEAGGRVPAREVDVAGVDHRRRLPRRDVRERRLSLGAHQCPRDLQHRLDHALHHVHHRRGRCALPVHRAARPQRPAAPRERRYAARGAAGHHGLTEHAGASPAAAPARRALG